MNSATKTILVISMVVLKCFSQVNFVVNPLVQMEGYNTNFKISDSQPWSEELVYICWESTIDSSTFNVYRMIVDPYQGAPEIIASSNYNLRSPDVNPSGDLVWTEIVGGISSIKHYLSDTDSTSTLVNDSVNATEPQLCRGGMVYIHGDTLKLLNFENRLEYNLDHGGISNLDLQSEQYYSYINIAYEKSEGDARFIRTSTSSYDGSNQSINDIGLDYQCSNPSYGTAYFLSYQAMIDSSWSIATLWNSRAHPYDMTNPFIVSTGIITAREVEDYLILFESDSIENNREIFCIGLPSNLTNISNIPGNDYNPQAFHTSMSDSVAVIWEHELENGRELWWAKDTLLLPVSVEPKPSVLPNSYLVGNAYPNPFNGNTHINYYVGTPTTVEISVFDLGGRLLSTTHEIRSVGNHTYSWNGLKTQGQACESGVYLLTFSGGRSSESRKIVLLK